MVMTALYAMVGVLAYFFAMEGGQDLVEDNQNIGRYLYYSSQVAYILAAASVGLLLLRAEDRTTALKTAFRRSQAMMSEPDLSVHLENSKKKAQIGDETVQAV